MSELDAKHMNIGSTVILAKCINNLCCGETSILPQTVKSEVIGLFTEEAKECDYLKDGILCTLPGTYDNLMCNIDNCCLGDMSKQSVQETMNVID